MNNPRQSPENSSEAAKKQNAEDRRSHRREEGVMSQIEDITYKVLRQHEPKRS